MVNDEHFQRGYITALEHAAEICRVYIEVWETSGSEKAGIRCKAVQQLKTTIEDQIEKAKARAGK